MKPFSNVRIRCTATLFAMLFWALALVFGTTNACLLKTSDHRLITATSNLLDGLHADAHAHHAALMDAITIDANHDADASRALCIKACDDNGTALVKLPFGVDLLGSNVLSVVVFAWSAAAPIAYLPNRFNEHEIPIVGPPFRVRYSRLAL